MKKEDARRFIEYIGKPVLYTAKILDNERTTNISTITAVQINQRGQMFFLLSGFDTYIPFGKVEFLD